MRDVAERAQVSVATVSHVINDTHYVSPELRQRVLDAIEELNYRPNRLARALSRKDVPMLALIVPDISNPYWSSVARAVQDVTDKYDYSVIVCSHDGLFEREIRLLFKLREIKISEIGLIRVISGPRSFWFWLVQVG